MLTCRPETENEDMISINATLILTILNFILMIGVLAMILWKPMVKFLDERAQKISESLKIAEENKKRAEELKVEFEKVIRDGRRKATEIVDRATTAASEESRQIVSQARHQAQATVDAAKDEITMEAERIKGELRKEMAAMTIKLTEKVLEREIKEKDHRKLINSSLDALES